MPSRLFSPTPPQLSVMGVVRALPVWPKKNLASHVLAGAGLLSERCSALAYRLAEWAVRAAGVHLQFGFYRCDISSLTPGGSTAELATYVDEVILVNVNERAQCIHTVGMHFIINMLYLPYFICWIGVRQLIAYHYPPRCWVVRWMNQAVTGFIGYHSAYTQYLMLRYRRGEPHAYIL